MMGKSAVLFKSLMKFNGKWTVAMDRNIQEWLKASLNLYYSDMIRTILGHWTKFIGMKVYFLNKMHLTALQLFVNKIEINYFFFFLL